jgi:hypothetical protein
VDSCEIPRPADAIVECIIPEEEGVNARIIIVIMTGLAAGRVYVPVKSPTYLSSAIGSAGSEAPLKVGTATRAEVIARFGEPTYSTEHGLAIGYLRSAKIGHISGVLLGPCSNPYFGSNDQHETDDFWLEFDERSILKRFVVHRKDSDKDQESWLLFCIPVPDKPRADQLWFFDQDKLPHN